MWTIQFKIRDQAMPDPGLVTAVIVQFERDHLLVSQLYIELKLDFHLRIDCQITGKSSRQTNKFH